MSGVNEKRRGVRLIERRDKVGDGGERRRVNVVEVK